MSTPGWSEDYEQPNDDQPAVAISRIITENNTGYIQYDLFQNKCFQRNIVITILKR